MRSKRETEFSLFAHIVEQHIANYTIPQYGDSPKDTVENWTPDQCIESCKKYCNRFGSNQRGRLETLRDMAKIAHYTAMTFFKLNPTDAEIEKIINGKV